MPCENGLTLSKRKHGACVPGLGLFSSVLVALCCVEVWGSEPRGCTPCPLNCSCALAGPLSSCVVNCSNIGLEKAPAATDLPLATNVLDLSKNRISSFDTSLLDHLTFLRELYLQGNRINVLPRGVFCCGPLSVLDLSNNQITTVKERICDNPCNLTQIDLSSNPFDCDCKLLKLVSWLQKKGVRVRRPEFMLCNHPPELHQRPLLNISLLTCGMNYAACLEDSSSAAGGRSELVIFSSSTPGNFSREQCTGVCLMSAHRYGGLGARRECLCSTNSEPNFISESQCSAACTNPHVMEDCGWTLADDVFAVDFSVSVKPVSPQNVHDQIAFSAASSVSPVALSWDFGDLSPRVNTSETEATKATHKYGLPGQYKVGVSAWMGHKEQVSAQVEVTVMLPPKLQLQCPTLSVANKSLEVSLLSWGALGLSIDWKISRDSAKGTVAKASPHCPGGVVHNETSHCFEILPEEMNWTDARHQCLNRGGDLAIVRSEALRGLLSLKVTQERGVWLGLSDVQSPGKLFWVNGSEVVEGEEGPPPRSVIIKGNMCISLDQRGQTSAHPCNIKRAYVCEHKPQVRVPDAGVYMVGLAVFPAHNPLLLVQADLRLTPKPTSGSIEVLLFPELSFVHAGRLSSLEFDTLELQGQVQIRFQIYRPHCNNTLHRLLPGCGGVACAPVAVCVSIDSLDRDALSCPPLQQWCPFQQQCLALSVPCPSASCSNCSHTHTLPPEASRPRYMLQNEVVFTLPAGPSTHVLIQEQVEDLLVSPGDVFALQHDAGPGSLFHCQPTPHSPWHQSVLAINQSEWFWLNNTGTSEEHEASRVPYPELDIDALVVDGEARWLQEVVCPVRVLYVGYSETQLQGEHLITGLREPGLYSLTVFSSDPSYPASDTCQLRVVPPLGLTVIHPTLQNGSIYLQPNDTQILLRVQSRYSTNATWANHTLTFLPICPPQFLSRPGLCQPSPTSGSQAELIEPSQYAVLDLCPGLEGQERLLQLELEAYNNVTEATLSVAVHLEEPLRGLVVAPHPAHRVLMESVVSYTASVLKGSNPTFKWTVDDKPYFTYYNTVLNVIYQHAAVYKLTVTAMNHVSSITEHFNVTVDRLVPMANLSVRGVPDVVIQGSTQTFDTSVLLDMSVTATFRWSFGDGGYKEFEYKPPYSPSLQSLDSPSQVLLSNNVTYVYSQPGIYQAVVSVSNRYENISQSITMNVYSVLNHVDIQTEPPLLLAGQPAEFEAHPLPSPYGIHYDWHFGDTSAPQQGRRVAHTYTQSGAFNICVLMNNTISSLTHCAKMFVFEKIENLTTNSSSPSELNCPTLIWAHITSGNNVTWTFSMDDGSIHTVPEPYISHHYTTEGNYTVNVTASNAVSSAWTVLSIHVFIFEVVRIEPTGCVLENTPINFLAFVTGNASAHLYEWNFGDESAIEIRHGSSQVCHTYGTSGNYSLTLTISSGASRATKNMCVCVQPALKNVSFTSEKTHYAVEEDVLFEVIAEPSFNYSYQWDFGQGDGLVLVQGSGNVVTKYTDPGQYIVTVTVFNNISSLNTSICIEIQMRIGSIVIVHNGTKYNNFTLREPYAFHTTSVATNVSYTWDFGDGFVASGANVIHAYNVSENFNITLTAVNTVSNNHTVLPLAVLAPIRNLTLNSSLIKVPLNASVNFEAHMDEGDGVRYSWILCDHCSSIAGTNTMFYTFRSVGTFTIIVTAENDIGITQASILLFVQRELEGLYILPEDEISGSGPMEGCCYATNRVLHLQAGLKEGTNMTFTWNLIRELDPHSSIYNLTGKTVDISFSTPGPCDIVLRAANLLGQLTVNRTIYFLEPAQIVAMKVSHNPVAVNSPINITVLANKGSDLQYRWSINKDILDWNMPSKMHSFDAPGLKLVEIEVFNEVSSKTVSETVNVEEIITRLKFTATNVTEQSYVSAGFIVWLEGEVSTGTNVTWTWMLDGHTKTGNKTSYVFLKPKQTVIALKASNDISEQVVSREVVVQERISGLELKANKQIVAVGEKVEFNVTLAAGTDAQILLSISGDNTVFLQPNKTYVHIFTRVDTYMVNVTALNQVSFKKYFLQVKVLEPIRGLSILGCCPTAIPVGVKKTFVPNILTGSDVSFLWTFDLHHLHKTSHMSKEVPYVPEEPGVLTIYLKAFNNLHDVNITKHILVQNLLSAAALYAAPRDTFINKTVTLMVSVTPQHTHVHCQWDMGDGSSDIHADTTIGYIYKQPGHYLVQVNCSNQVSWVLGQVEVNITVLECEEPEVQVVQAPRLSIWRAQPTLVEANVDLKGCVRYGEQYLWQILAAPSCDNSKDDPVISEPSLPVPVIQVPEVDMRRLQLSLPKMSLPAGSYSLVFSLSYEGVPLRKAACLQLTVMAARLMPIIEGGTYRVWSRTQDLQLSAEQSSDPNMDPESHFGLHYKWDCIATSEGPEHCSTLNLGWGSSDPVWGIPRAELEAGVEYTFKVTISKDGMAPESTTQTVLVQSGHIPMVYLECVSCKAQSFYEVSENSYIFLKGICTNCEGFHRWRWSAMTSQNETFVLDSTSTTTGSDGMYLVLRQGVLRERVSYIFTLHVTDPALDGEGAASITLHRNMPPAGGECHLKAGGDAGVDYTIEDSDIWRIQTLVDRVHFNCSGFSDVGVSETPLLYSLLVTRCKEDYCEDLCVYRGSSPEHAAFLPPGFSSSRHRVAVSITVEDHQGATTNALNKSIEVGLPDQPLQYSSLPHWLSDLTDTKLKKLLEQGDSQRVRELSLALITVLNEYEQTRQWESRSERLYRVRVRSNITKALTSLDLTTVNDIQQTSAALAQCTAVSREFICEECQNSTLNKLESMLKILQTDTKQGTVTPTEIADNILNIMGDLIHQVSQSASQMYLAPAHVDASSQLSQPSDSIFSPIEDHGNSIFDSLPPSMEPHPLRVAAKAYSLSSVLMLILMHARVLNEEPLRLRGAEIAATGKLADPQSLLCYHGNNSPECQRFSIPRAFNKSLGKAAAGTSIMQLLFQVESNPFPFNYVPNYTVSTEVASMEFRTENGTQIPISGLDDSLAITVAVNNGSTGIEGGAFGSSFPGLPTAGSVNISHCDSVIVKVNSRNTNRQAGLFVQLNFTSLDDGRHNERGIDEEVPYITAYLHSHDSPNEFNCTCQKHITLNMTQGPDLDHKKFTFFLSPESYDTTLEYFINVSTPCSHRVRPVGVRLEVGVFASLCQYFNESDKQWRTDGMVPLAETNATRAVCRTRHLTAFAAGLFVPPNAVSFKIPERYGAPSLVVLLVCVLGLLSYVVAAAILHKLDQLDLRRAGVVPLCGQDGLFKYEVQVKTGWSQGAGTTAHVGISLYGRESRSGHRHLDSRGAFTRNALDIFHIATDTSLGSVWKIRIWHDNKGLSPAWLLQYVLVKDLQTGSSYYFLIDDWLSVDNDRTERKVEIEVEASEDAALRQLPRLLRSELERAVCESHLWLSLWERPPRSPFTRLQRATCCALLLQLILMANSLWYSIVTDKRISPRAVSTFVPLNGETVAAGVVVCLVVYPLYLLVFTLFRMSRSKCVTVEQVPPQVDQESVEIDDFLDNSMAGSSFLFFSGETNSEETNVDLPTPSTKSDESSDFGDEYMEDRDWPELMSEESVEGGAGHGAGLPRLKRGQGSRHLGVDIAFNPDNEDGQHNKYFTSSDEDLIKHILADGQNFFPQADESEMADLSSIFGDKTEVILLQKLNEPLPLETVRRDPPKTAFTSNTVVTDVCRPRRFPPWCGRAALWGSWAGIALANCVSIWTGHGFNQKVAMMWLISCFASVLCSCLLLEPMKVICEAVYYAVCVRRLRPEDQDVLVEFPRVERVVQRVHRVRPPQGFALSQARHQARKVHMLHTMLKNFLVYMFLLLVVILLNYSDSTKDTHSLRLRTQLQHALHTPEYHSINRREDIVTWLNGSLLPRLLDDSRLLQDTGSVLLGTIRLRQVHDIQDINILDDSSLTSPSMAKRVRPFGKRRVLERGDLLHLLNRSLGDAISSLEQLQQQHWFNFRTRAVVVDFSLYNINTNLLAVFSFLFNFPVSERAQCSLSLLVTSLWPITGLDLPLLLTMVLFVLAMYFLVRGILGYLNQGYTYLLSSWRVMGLCKLTLALSVCGLHLSRCIMAKQQWTSFLRHPQDAFTDFSLVARQSQLYTVMAALLLFILVLKASHQLRFLREWAVFGRALRRSGWELLSLALALLLLLLAYAHTGHLLFHSVFDSYSSVGSACLSLLGTGGRGLLFWRPVSALTVPSSSISTLVFHTSFSAIRLVVVWFVIAVLLRNYRRARAELYRPAVDLQDYEMVELFLRRLKMWMGLSRAKEFRHKVRFEGMDLPPSRSSSTSDCRSLCLPPLDRPDSPSTPDSVDAGSEASWRPASSSPCSLTEAPGASLGLGLGLGLGLSPGLLVGGTTWKEKAETEAALGRVLPTLDALLQQLDRVTMATENLYYVECKLEKAQRKRKLREETGLGPIRQLRGPEEDLGGWRIRKSSKEKQKTKKGKKGDKSDAKDTKKTPVATPVPFMKSKSTPSHFTASSSMSKSAVSAQDHTPPPSSCSSSAPPHTASNKSTPAPPPCTPAPSTSGPSTCASTPTQSGLSSLFNHPAHTTTIPTRKRKRKPPPLKNKVHPN